MAKEKFRRVSEVEFDLDKEKDLNFTFGAGLGSNEPGLSCVVSVKHGVSSLAMPPPAAVLQVADVLSEQELESLASLLAKLAAAGITEMGMIK
jgi:hypothetical protein